MIVGDGLLARAFAPAFGGDAEVLVFASGVANSAETDPAAFARERALFDRVAARHAGRLLYFGTCAADGDAASPYLEHKRAMEARVLARGGVVLRLPQVVGASRNPHTLANFLAGHIREGRRFTVWAHAERNLVDVADVARIAAAMVPTAAPASRFAIAAPRSLAMPALVRIFERVLGRAAVHDEEPRGEPMPIEAAAAHAIARSLGIDLEGDYVERVVRRYYGGGPP